MKSVALVITRMIPGGASTVVCQIIAGAKKSYDLTLFTGEEDLDKQIIAELKPSCKIIKIPTLVRNISPVKDYLAYSHLVREFREADLEVVHTHTSKAGFIGRLAAAKAKVPVIIHSPHGTIYTSNSIDGVPSFSIGKKILQTAERYAGWKMSFLTTLSEHEKEICIELGLARDDNTKVIPNGINCPNFVVSPEERIKARESFKLERKDIVVISVGRLSSEKGHATLIAAFAKVKNKLDSEGGRDNQAIKLILVGDGPEMNVLQKQAESLGLMGGNDQASVIFAGHQNDIKGFLATADIFVLPSFYEGFGIALVEAMAAGVPVLASNVGGIPEIITDGMNGVLFTAGDAGELVKKIMDLICSPDKRESLKILGIKRAEDFSIDKMLEGYMSLYSSATEEGKLC